MWGGKTTKLVTDAPTQVRKQNSRQYVDRDMLGALPKQLRVEIYDYLRPSASRGRDHFRVGRR